MVMVDSINFDTVKKSNFASYYPVENISPVRGEDYSDVSIFAQSHGKDMTKAVNESLLEDQLSFVQKEHGTIMKGWDKVKGAVGIGASSDKCNDAIEKYKKGEISFDEAMSEIEKFDKKQDSSLDLFSNIATGVAAIGVATVSAAAIVASGGTATPLVLAAIGAGTGAVAKVGFKATDRATNDVDGDALNGKQIAKDALSGAVTGGLSVATAGTAGTPFAAGGTKACITQCAKTGFKTGAISGASNYTIDCAFEDDKEFNFNDFASTTVTSSIAGGTVGALMGGFNGTLRANNLLNHGGQVDVANTTKDVLANAACSTEYKLLNKGVRAIAS